MSVSSPKDWDFAFRVAKVAHEINRAYCASLGDDSQVPWEEAPAWQRASAVAGVELILAHRKTTAEESHAGWLKLKLAEGWTYGETKDPEKKTHPCCVPYSELPLAQRAKDAIFGAAVREAIWLSEVEGTWPSGLAVSDTEVPPRG